MLDDLKKTLWATADKLRANMDAAEYKHLVGRAAKRRPRGRTCSAVDEVPEVLDQDVHWLESPKLCPECHERADFVE